MSERDKQKEPEDPYKAMNYALIKHSDMKEDVRTEAVEASIDALEKHSGNYENVARQVKETMDKKFGGPWNCVVGQGYGFEVEHEVRHMCYLFFGGTTAVVLWKL